MNVNNKPTERTQAVALSYDVGEQSAPKVVAKGIGVTADNILQLAQQNAIPVYKNKPLTQMLMVLELEQEIPPELYQAVAEVLSYVYKTEQILAMKKRINNEEL